MKKRVYSNFTPFTWTISQNHFLAAILDAILNFNMKNAHPDLTPRPKSLSSVSYSKLNHQTFSKVSLFNVETGNLMLMLGCLCIMYLPCFFDIQNGSVFKNIEYGAPCQFTSDIALLVS